MDPLLGVAGAVLTLLGVLFSTWLTSRASNRKLRSDSGQQMIDQLQEEVSGLRARVAQLERNQRVQDDYIGQLRMHIADRQPPPPPAWPNQLIT